MGISPSNLNISANIEFDALGEGKIVAEGTPDEVRASTDLYVRQFVDGQPDGPVPFHYPAPPYRDTLFADVEV